MFELSQPTALRVLTVSELTAQIRVIVEDCFDSIAVVGEVSNAKAYPSGHWYFSLKDKEATLPAVCFKNANQNIKFNLEDGLMVVAKGKLSVYPPRGAYQMVVTSLEPVGIGDWQLAFEQLKTKLGEEGLLAPERKRPIPSLPRRIGVVTSIAGAALRDILTALKRRNPNVQVLIASTKVQGEGSTEEIAQAIYDLQNFDDIDVIIVARGGGSIEDLWSFNSEAVARAVASSRIPVISGIGHETDFTICDLVADLRAPTPTAAAELVSKGRLELLEKWTSLNYKLGSSMEQRLIVTRHALHKLHPRNALARHEECLRKLAMDVKNKKEHLSRLMTGHLSESKHIWQRNHEKLQALNAKNILGRGFSILQKTDGTIIRQISDVSIGESIIASVSNGKIRLKVESYEDGN
ncbi:MAG: exodeoxyribonuclease VII large subunit [Candidatus Obscuribacterales bacterium]|nr:exodeoxyribonuclease VII large subunit [Candidatus Obscuribacterales bacterium]